LTFSVGAERLRGSDGWVWSAGSTVAAATGCGYDHGPGFDGLWKLSPTRQKAPLTAEAQRAMRSRREGREVRSPPLLCEASSSCGASAVKRHFESGGI